MPISDIVKFALGIIGALAVLHGPLHLGDEMRKLEIQILRETSRTDNWGNVDIFAGHPYRVHAVTRLSPINHRSSSLKTVTFPVMPD